MRNFNKRNFKKIDCSISLSVLLACVLTVIAACVESSGPLGGPNVVQAKTVSLVKVSLAQPTLALGQSTQATVVATSADGQVVNGVVDFSSQNPSVATVSSKGVVSALAAGVAMIQATVGSHAASATLTVKLLAAPTAVVAVVAVALDSTSLAIGHSAKASAIVMDSVGNLMVGQTVTWASLSPTVATVSSDGTLTAVTPGSATIQGTVSGKTGTASLTVAPNSTSIDSVLAFSDFNGGTPGPYAYLGTPGPVDYPNDPTGSGRGKVNRIFYTVPTTFQSNDVNMELNTAHRYRYGETIWFKGDFYIPSTLSDGVTPKTALQNDDTRKLIDYFNGELKPRLIILRQNRALLFYVGQIEADGNYHEDITIGNTGIIPADDKWHTIEVMYKLNSADGVKDGVLDIYVDNPSATPDVHLAKGIFPITQGVNGGTASQQTAFDAGGSYLSSFRFGTQLTTYGQGEGAYSEYRYWDNVTFSRTRIGH
jgi:hypothetical protein